MTARTYTLDADMCDEWVSTWVAPPVAPLNRSMIDAIRAQQPKSRIPWAAGRIIRAIGPGPASWLMANRVCFRWVVCVAPGGGVAAGAVHVPEDLFGYDGESFDPEMWEVVA